MRRAYRLFGTGRPLTVATALNEHFAGPPVWTARRWIESMLTS
jgi:hypothetical protein